ncbi:glycosyltransferase [Phycicoccus flavus]|uniref:glycosyltransferase n=1 Tax=Phycicoccus flavus TaxID=2502783 RepID=UPI000FEC126B|nr:glycosyltransferase [Phycicoccus flavus]NHA66686.1 glycosyltransferase [Phycicoccus flavus]
MTAGPPAGDAPARDCLVLYTNYFPYHRGEEYLEAELPFLLERFRRVVLVPVMYETGMTRSRAVPSRVDVVAVDMPSGRPARAGHVARHAATAARTGLLAGAARPTSPRAFLYDLYFTTRGLEFWRRSHRAVLEAVGDATDVVVYSYWLYVTAFEAVLLRRALGERVALAVSRAHRYDVVKEVNAVGFLPQRRLLLEGLDRVHPVSDQGRDSLVDDVPDLADRVTVRRLGVAPPLGRGPRTLRPRLEVVSCSSLKPVKQVPLLLDALALLHGRGVPVRWTHFGGDGAALDRLREAAGRALPADAVALRGHLANAEVLEHYASAPVSVFVNVSTSEGVPVSVMEAMAHGVPAVATAAGGTGQLVTDGRDGRLLPVDADAVAVADALEDVWRLTPAAYGRLVEQAHTTWATGWATTAVYPEFAAALAGVNGS